MFIPDPARLVVTGATMASLTDGCSRLAQGRDGSRTVLLLNNELAGQARVAHALGRAGHLVVRAGSVAAALAVLHAHVVDAIVVDLRPDLLGQEATCALRASGVDQPILAIAARTTPDARQRTLALGADGMVALPLDQAEIVASLEAVMQSGPRTAPAALRIGPLTLDPANRRVRAGDACIQVTDAEFSVLELLAVRNGAPVRIETIQQRLHEVISDPSRKTVTRIVGGLRRKLVPFAADKLVVTVRGLGFALRVPSGTEHGFAGLSWLRDDVPGPSAGGHYQAPPLLAV
ncbi:hypothetical protein CCS01_26565 [Rhodopila globiformis]|uniref:OmpR/PhoB-type domain-containing protein n=2 Tax=Rhodopila globiformis TaxID=1071 RepID=A0A2S6MZF0_RHOGL|nr:hypothetical protein CCS01_26565 [Rhodopila globiformis]